MKRIIAAILLIALSLTLFSCGAKPEHTKIDFANVSSVNFVVTGGAAVDKEAVIEAYNDADVISKADDEYTKSKDVIVIVLTGDRGAYTVYYTGESRFAVSGTGIEEAYIIESAELEKLYLDVVDPKPQFIKLVGSYSAFVTKAPDKEIDTAALAKHYNESELVGKAKNETSSDVIVVKLGDGEKLLLLTYLEDSLFRVSGTDCKVDYIIKSEGLEKLYTEAVK